MFQTINHIHKLSEKIAALSRGKRGNLTPSVLHPPAAFSICSFFLPSLATKILRKEKGRDQNCVSAFVASLTVIITSLCNRKSQICRMAVSFKYWDDCIEPHDLEALWMDPYVATEWDEAGETVRQKVHLSRDPDGQPYLTQTEMRAVAGIIVSRHFVSQIDLDMICAIAELESDRQLIANRYNKKTKETTVGLMQILPNTVDWLARELGYQTYQIEGNHDLLYRPFINVYFGAAYLKWLSNFDQKERSEEFIVRAYKGGTDKATHKSTLEYWRRYLSVKERLPSRSLPNNPFQQMTVMQADATSGAVITTWDSKTSPEDMAEMWNHPNVSKEWSKCGEQPGNVRFSHDAENRPYLSRVELMAVAEIILSKHFITNQVKPTHLCALAETVSMRFVNGVGHRPGIMGIDYPTACWIYKDLGFQAYKVESSDDLTKPFVSLYYGAAYMAWLSKYEERERTPEFVVQAYHAGPTNVNLQETGPLWFKFEEALSKYGYSKRDRGSCSIM